MIDTGEWVYGYYIKNSEDRSFIVQNLYVDKIGNPSNMKPSIKCFEVDPETVGQYVKKKDKNNKEIYEDDILRYTNEKYPKRNQPLHSVCWDERGAKFILTTKRGKKIKSWLPFKQWIKTPLSRWEIIGNSYENPELIT